MPQGAEADQKHFRHPNIVPLYDVGDQDGLRAGAARLHEILDNYGVANTFEIYSGTHTSAVAVRFQNFVMPFFGKNLCSGKNCI